MNRIVAFTYGTVCYAIFLALFLYTIGFLGNFIVPKTVDSGPAGPVATAVAVNLLLLGLFAIQHSVMARPGFKRWWTRIVPWPVERSTYVLATCVVLGLLFWQWRPIQAPVWDVTHPAAAAALQALFVLGVGTVLYSTFLIDHFDLFGLRQVFLHLRGRPYQHKRFATPSLYKHIRHPLYVGWFLTFWATSTMTAGHLLLAIGITAYILVAIVFEERDLLAALGEDYRRWRDRTPMFVPRTSRGSDAGTARRPVGQE